MSSEEIRLPRLSMGMEDGEIVEWLKQPGDSVKVGDILVEIDTGKALTELECPLTGILSKVIADRGSTITVGDVIAVIDVG